MLLCTAFYSSPSFHLLRSVCVLSLPSSIYGTLPYTIFVVLSRRFGALAISYVGSTLLPGAAEVFYRFMAQREIGRERKDVLHLPREKWYSGVWESMAAIRLTNVRRMDDVTTQLVAAVCRPAADAWQRFDCRQWQARMLGLFVFHCALWRTFGARAFITACGFNCNLFSWDETAWQQIAAIATAARTHAGSAFTDAYGPARYNRLKEKNLPDATSLYLDVCATLTTIWDARFQIARGDTWCLPFGRWLAGTGLGFGPRSWPWILC